MTALIVEDDPVSTIVLRDALEDLGYEVTESESGEEAWKLLQEKEFRLVIADWVVPGMSGLELCRRIRTGGLPKYVYVVLLTTYTERTNRLESIEAGVDDFLTKPLARGDLKACLTVAERILSMEEALRKANRQIELARQRELEIGSRIQQTLLDGIPPARNRFFEIASFSLPSSQIDGDFVEFFEHGEHVVDVLIGDGMGKGLTAALLCAGTKAFFQKALNRLLVARVGDELPSPREIVQHVHNHLARDLITLESFVTLTYIRMDAIRGVATIVDCGHMPPIFWLGSERRADVLVTSGNFPLGFTDDETYMEKEFPISPGDAFILYSDGLTEARSAEGEEFGVDRLISTVLENDHLPLEEFVVQIREKVIRYTKSDRFEDDFTCVVVQWNKTVPEEIQLPRDHDALANLRGFVSASAAHAGLPRQKSQELQLAAHEFFRNLVEHGQSDTHGPVRVGYRASIDQYELRFEYEGTVFDPPHIDLPDLESFPEEGFGLFIIENSVDELRHAQLEDGTAQVVMRKDIPVSF